MNLLYISPNYPSYNVKSCLALKEKCVNILGIGDSYDIPPGLRAALSDYYVIPDIHDYDSVYRATAFLISRYGRIDKAVSLIPYWYDIVEQLCHDYRIEHCEPDPKKLFSLSPAALVAETVPFDEFSTLASGRAFAKKHGYPLYFRPNNGWQQDELMENLKGITKKVGNGEILKYTADRYIAFEGLAQNSKITAICGMVYPYLPEKAAQENRLFSFFTFKVSPSECQLCENILGTYGITDSLFKLIFIKNSEKLVLLRAEPMISGGFSADFMNLCGIDICSLWTDMMVGEKSDTQVLIERSVVYVSRRFDRSYSHTHPEILRKYADVMISCGLSNESGNSAAGDYYYYAEISSTEQADEMIDYIQSDFTAS